MHWVPLENQEVLTQFMHHSQIKPQQAFAIFKHSNRCSISSMAKNRLESQKVTLPNDFPFLLLDLLKFRELSNSIAHDLNVAHESPQLILVKNGKAVYVANHNDINLLQAASVIAEWSM